MTMGCSQFCKEDMARPNVIYNDILLYMSDFPRPFELFWPTKGSENRTTANRGGVGVFTVSFRVLWSWYTVCYITFGTTRGEWVACLPNHVRLCYTQCWARQSTINNQRISTDESFVFIVQVPLLLLLFPLISSCPFSVVKRSLKCIRGPGCVLSSPGMFPDRKRPKTHFVYFRAKNLCSAVTTSLIYNDG